VLVRYLTGDDRDQAAAAERVIEQCRTRGEPIFLAAIILCELVWVLTKTYRRSKAQIAHVIDEILATEQFRIEHDPLVRRSVEAWRAGPGDLSDYLIGEIGRGAGCRDTVTFDRALKRAKGFTVLA
jgi:predicted nucleic-acid-binding protein